MKFIVIYTADNKEEYICNDQIESVTKPSGRVNDEGHLTLKSGRIVYFGDGSVATRVIKELENTK